MTLVTTFKVSQHLNYGLLTIINQISNLLLSAFKLNKVSLSGSIKKAIKKRKNNILSTFERVVSDLTIKKEYENVICGHTHWPDKKIISNKMVQAILRNDIRWSANINNGHYTVYLPSYADNKIIEIVSVFHQIKWQVFSKHSTKAFK